MNMACSTNLRNNQPYPFDPNKSTDSVRLQNTSRTDKQWNDDSIIEPQTDVPESIKKMINKVAV